MNERIKQVTVKELADSLNSLVERGFGDKKIVLSDDNEGNGFHGCFFTTTSDKESIKHFVKSLSDSAEMNPDNIIIIG